jgi:hypothetical protein
MGKIDDTPADDNPSEVIASTHAIRFGLGPSLEVMSGTGVTESAPCVGPKKRPEGFCGLTVPFSQRVIAG